MAARPHAREDDEAADALHGLDTVGRYEGNPQVRQESRGQETAQGCLRHRHRGDPRDDHRRPHPPQVHEGRGQEEVPRADARGLPARRRAARRAHVPRFDGHLGGQAPLDVGGRGQPRRLPAGPDRLHAQALREGDGRPHGGQGRERLPALPSGRADEAQGQERRLLGLLELSEMPHDLQ